ncbi:hypothetical protein YC2023_011261 [Brassica napus]
MREQRGNGEQNEISKPTRRTIRTLLQKITIIPGRSTGEGSLIIQKEIQTKTLEIMRLLENDDHIRLIGLKEKTSFYLQIGIRLEPAIVASLWKVATLEMQMNLNQGKLKSENRNMIFQSLLLERVVRYLLLKPNLCGMNSNAEWIETHKCIIGEQ